MKVTIGQRLGSFEVSSVLGEGGMGKVWRATDSKLGREVALKVLPEGFADDPDRHARFEREARVLASLNHPNIATLHALEHSDDQHILVMELVEGEGLDDRIARGAIPVDEAIPVALQIAEALEAAHEAGIVHRDLKPANIRIRPDGTVKVLDFGLAKAWETDAGDSSLSLSPTMTQHATAAGVILGTAAYMSPEQARGKKVDRRADIWSFGVMLWEMLTGKKLFDGDSVSDVLAAVLRADPDWQSLPENLQVNTRRVLRRCLVRDPHARLHSVADARLELQEDEPMVDVVPARRRSALMPVAMVVSALSILAATWIFRASEPIGEAQPIHLALAFPDGLQVASSDRLPLGLPQPCVAISDDGRLVVVVVERDETTWLLRRSLDQAEGELLEDTQGAYHPQISPDGEWISFMTGNTLRRMAARGDRATSLIELPNSFGHTWVNNREIVINREQARELVRVDTERGTETPYESGEVTSVFDWPSRVPGRDAVLISNNRYAAGAEGTELNSVSLLDLQSSQHTVLGIGGSVPRLLSDGTLLVVRDGQLMAAPVGSDRIAESARPEVVLDGMLVEDHVGQYAVSEQGTLVYVPGKWLFGKELVWDDGQGNVEELAFPSLVHGDFELAPDARQVAITVGESTDLQVWIYDLERGGRRLLTTGGTGSSPIWAPDGERIAYRSTSGDRWGVLVQTVGSTDPPVRIFESDLPMSPYVWRDGIGILAAWDRGIVRIDPDTPGEPVSVVDSDASEWGPDISPDGRWFAYTSDESGRYEIFARAIGGDRSYPVSVNGGEEPIFSDDGRSLYFRNGNRFYSTPILEASADGSRFRVGQPEAVVEGAYSNVPGLSYDVGPDGRLLLLRTDGGTERPTHLNVILNWNVAAVTQS